MLSILKGSGFYNPGVDPSSLEGSFFGGIVETLYIKEGSVVWVKTYDTDSATEFNFCESFLYLMQTI